MRRSNNYGTYRGRSAAAKVLKVIIVLLAAILLLTVGAVIYLGQFQVFSADGPRLDLPFLPRESPSAPVQTAAPAQTPSLVVVTPEPTAPPQLHIAPLPREALYDGTALSKLEAAGANGVWFDMKADDGTLGYVSTLPLAIEAKTSSGIPALNEAIKALNATEGLYTVARVSCFRDNLISDVDKNLNILTNSGYKWTDAQKLKWSSPTNETVRAYVASVCADLAALGFDEILLDNAGYPTQGTLGYIRKGPNYNQDQLDQVVSQFYKEVRTALSAYPGVKLSVVTTEAALDGTDAKSGQTPANLSAVDRIWVAPAVNETSDYVRTLSAAGMTVAGAEGTIIFLLTEPGDTGMNWAIWPGGA